jgi:hypothetical protein
MPRYFTTRPRAALWVEDEHYSDPIRPGTPTVDDHVATDTGLLDHFGNTIWRAPRPMGFGRRDD